MKLTYIFIILTAFLPTVLFGQNCVSPKKHSLDSCKNCNCKKWHREFSVDSLTKEKIIRLKKQKEIPNISNFDTIEKNHKFHIKEFQYFTDGQIHMKKNIRTTKKGRGYNLTVKLYDKSGRLTYKKKFTIKNG